jgi:hypothetical protein
MASLGEFNAAVAELDPDREKDTVIFMGETFTVIDVMPEVLAIQMGAAASGMIDETEGLAAVWQTLRFTLGEDEFKRWYQLAIEKRASLQAQMGVAMAIFQAQTGRPTVQAPDSSAGPAPTSPSSSASSSHPGLAHLRPVSEVLTG